MSTTYVLKSQSGNPLVSFDDRSRAEDMRRDREKKGVKLRLFKVQTTETEIE